ncbi:hypothetical protein LR002_01930 [Candidatus Gracilibacteria bacterium]|nr:hypothetical protein [Candidatus Gracilibacteria bacterium]
MKIKWTTIESGRNKTKSQIENVLENKNKLSLFFAENKKHLFGAGISTMAMIFVVGAGQMSGTEFSANLMFPTMTQEIQNTNAETVGGDENGGGENLLGDLDLTFDEASTGTGGTETGSISTGTTIEKENKKDDTENLINDLFGETTDEKLNNKKTEETNLLQETTKNEKQFPETDLLKKETIDETDNLSSFLNEEKTTNEENFHNSAQKIEQRVDTIEVKKPKTTIFKQNLHTVDMNLVAQKAMLKDIPEDTAEMHGSAESFFGNTQNQGFGIGVEGSQNIQNNVQQNVQEYQNVPVLQKAKKLSQSGPEDMIFGLGFLSIILAYFFRRRKNI